MGRLFETNTDLGFVLPGKTFTVENVDYEAIEGEELKERIKKAKEILDDIYLTENTTKVFAAVYVLLTGVPF